MKATKTPIFDQGIQIVKPWSQEMYEHNDKVADLMKAQIQAAIDKCEAQYNKFAEQDDLDADFGTYFEDIETIAIALNAYGYGHGCDEFDYMHKDACKGLDQVQNHWLDSDTWPDLLKAGLVTPLEISFIGYKKY